MAEATQEMIALAREIVLNLYPDRFPGERAMILGGSWDRTPAVQAALAAIQATTERAAALNARQSGEDKAIMQELRPSKAAMEKIERMEQANAAGWAEIRSMPFGSSAESGEGEREAIDCEQLARAMNPPLWSDDALAGSLEVAPEQGRSALDISVQAADQAGVADDHPYRLLCENVGFRAVLLARLHPGAKGVSERITDYLASGGLFNPELANHGAVRDLLIDARAALAALSPKVQEGE